MDNITGVANGSMPTPPVSEMTEQPTPKSSQVRAGRIPKLSRGIRVVVERVVIKIQEKDIEKYRVSSTCF